MDKVDKYIEHATSNQMWQQDTQGMSSTQILASFKNRAVCPKCEKWAYRDKGWAKGKIARCPACGWLGAAITIDEYLTRRLYK